MGPRDPEERNRRNNLPSRLERELREEIRLYLEMRAEEFRGEGASAEEAWQAALAAFGDPNVVLRDAIREREGTTRGGAMMRTLGSLLRDVRFGSRSLLRSAGFSMVVVFTLAVGLGASTAMFSVIDGILIKPLPYPDPDRLVLTGLADNGFPPSYTSIPEFIDLRYRTNSFEVAAGVQRSSLTIGGREDPDRIETGNVTEGFFEALGAHAAVGRMFTPDEYRSQEPKVIILSHALWMARWGGDPSVVGRAIRADEDRSGSFRLLTVVGVLQADFVPPEALQTAQGAEAWLPLDAGPSAYARERTSRSLFIVGRLKNGVTLGAARADLQTLSSELRSTYSSIYAPQGARLGMGAQPLDEATVAGSRPMLLVLLSAAALLLLIGCANAANLIMARAIERRRELAMRSALGAGRARLVSQLLAECLLLAYGAGVVGMVGAAAAVHAAKVFGAGQVPRLASVSLDGRAGAFALLAALVTGVTFGLVPALAGSLRAGADVVRGTRGGVGRGAQRLRSILVVGETALAVIVLAAAGLLINSYAAVVNVDPGFVAEGVSYTEVGLGDGYPTNAERADFFASLVDQVSAIPGVASAGIIADPPMGYTMWAPPVLLPGDAGEHAPSVPAHLVDGGFFETLGIRITEGRSLVASDGPDGERVAVVNESMARRFWGNADPVGARFRFTVSSPWITVVGVSNDVLQGGLTSSPAPRFYVPFSQNGWFPYMNVVFKVRPGRTVPAEAVREALRRVDPSVPFEGVTSMRQRISDSLETRTFFTMLMAGFSVVAVLLASGGLYGTLRFVVERRTREVGIRLAVGGRPVRLMTMMLGQGMALVAGGIVLGVPIAALASRSLKSLLFGVAPSDPATLAVTSMILAAVAAVAAYLPARRATRVDPVDILREE